MTISEKSAVLLLAHGSPVSVNDIPEFLLHVTGGRPLPPEVIEEVKHRYGLIGASPLTCWTLEQRDLLARELGLPVYVGMRNWKPFIDEAVKEMVADGIQRVIAICLAPQNSRTSVGLYRSALGKNREVPFTIDFIASWHDHPLLIKAFAEKLHAGWDSACREAAARLPVIFTAHSVPQRTITDGDSYLSRPKAGPSHFRVRACPEAHGLGLRWKRPSSVSKTKDTEGYLSILWVSFATMSKCCMTSTSHSNNLRSSSRCGFGGRVR
jgi:protoheme ferro-lyase